MALITEINNIFVIYIMMVLLETNISDNENHNYNYNNNFHLAYYQKYRSCFIDINKSKC